MTPISYTIKQLAPTGYQAIEAKAMQGIDGEEAQAVVKTLAAPETVGAEGERIKLRLTENETELQAEKTFGNYLPVFTVSGTITWPVASAAKADRPDMEEYFKTQFTILRNDELYKNFRVEYAQDEADANVWNYTVKGLFATTEDGSSAAYTLQAGDAEGYELPEKTISVNGDKTDADFVWVEKQEEKKVTRAEGDITKGEQKGAASMEVNWMEPIFNNNHRELQQGGFVQVSYTIEGGNAQTVGFTYNTTTDTWEMTLTEEQKNALGLTDLPTNYFSYTTGTGTETFKLSNLPSTIKVEQADGSQTDRTVTWDIKLLKSPDGYLLTETTAAGAKDRKYNLIQHTEFNANIVIRNGAPTPAIVDMEKYLSVMVDGAEMTIEALKTKYPSARIQLTPNATGYDVKITGIPWCDDGKKEIIYAMKCNVDKIQEGSDYYVPHYDNMNSPNFGTNTSECHDGGSLVLTLNGKAEYTGTKIWLDEGDKTKRPDATWELWRYSQKPDGSGSYKTASPVQNDKGENVQWDLDKAKDTETIESVSDANLANGLPKYDTDGFLYVYFTRETLTKVTDGNTYEKVFGKVKDTSGDIGDIVEGSDKLPSGITRDSSDASLYNEGTLSNRITENKTITQKKTWKASAHQNELGDVRVELTLYSREKDPQGTWTEVQENGKAVTRELDGFMAEIMTKEIEYNCPVYNKLGKELEYQWKETAVYEGVGSTENLLKEDDKGNLTFQLSHNKPGGVDPADGKEWYKSTIEADGTIVNRLVGETEYYVDKLWAQLDGNGDPIKDADGKVVYGKTAPAGESITVKLLQDNKEIKDITLNGQEQPTTWAHLWDNLDKFNEDGVRHIYAAEEKTKSNWHSDYAYNLDELKPPTLPTGAEANCQIKNTPTGVGKTIKIKKVWLDDGDQEHREKITVKVYRAKVDDKNPEKDFKEVELTADKNWWKEIGVTEYMGDDGVLTTTKPTGKTDEEIEKMLFKDGTYFIREVKMGTSAVYIKEDLTNVTDSDKVSELPSKQPSQNTCDYVQTGHHKYEATYSQQGNEYTVSNRRVGRVNVAVEKKWLDGGSTEAERAALNAKISLQCVEVPTAVSGDETAGYVQIFANGKKHPILGEDNKTPVGMTQVLTGKDNQKLCFNNLPKYDENGKVIHYTLQEESPADGNTTTLKKADYSTDIKQTGYDVPENHDGDKQEMQVTNKKVGSKDVSFHKKWIDKYVYDSGKRPDIFLNLYKTVTDDTGKTTVEPMDKHVDSKWTKQNNDPYNWTCTYVPLPKYDDKGNEILYYATEGMHVDRETLDYIPEQYEHGSDKYSTIDWDDTNKKYTATHDAKGTDKVKNTTDQKQALKEDGTFVNELRKPLTIQGKKVWKNVPDGFPASELPHLKIIIEQSSSTQASVIDAWIDDVASDKYQMNFTFKYEKENELDGSAGAGQGFGDLLPKYEPATGELYKYEVTEEVVGGVTPGSGIDTAYEKLPGEVNDYLITNSYNTTQKVKSNVGTLKINKTWTGLETNYPKDKYPQIAFDVFRFCEYKSSTGTPQYSSLEKVTTATLKQGATELEIKELLVYAPNGNKYQYYVQERNVNGYELSIAQAGTVPTGSIPRPDNYDKLPTSGYMELDTDPVTTTRTKLAGVVANFLAPTVGGMLRASTRAVPTEISFTNKYKDPQDSVTVTGAKRWQDYENAYTSRPTDIELTVSRWAEAQGTGNDIATQEMFTVRGNHTNITLNNGVHNTNSTVGIAWKASTTDKSLWSYEITGLDRYAPNGNPWKYKIKETKVTEYTQTPSNGEVQAKATDSDGNITMKDLTNASYKIAAFTKAWGSENPHNLRPTSIEVKLQVKFGDAGTWADAGTALEVGTDLPKDLDVENKEIKAKDGKWESVSYKNLPAYKSGSACFYRVVETKIGNTDVTATDNTVDDTAAYNAAGLYKPEQTSYTSKAGAGKTDATTVTNTLIDDQITSLKVVKNWVDTENAYDTRPTEIKVKLQRTVTPQNDSSWEDVMQFGSTTAPVIHTIKPDANGDWEVEYKNLPKFKDASTEYHYRAVEVDGSKHYAPSYVSTDDTTGHVITITNTLTPTLEVSTDKTWKNGQGIEDNKLATGQTVILELKKNKKSFSTPVQVELDGTPDSIGEMTPWSATFKGMPKYESDGTTEIQYSVVEVEKDGTGFVPVGFWKTESPIDFTTGVGVATVTNRQTEFMLDKVDESGASISNLSTTLEIYKESGYGNGNGPESGATLMATWTRGTDGKESVTPNGNSTVETITNALVAPIKGLPQGAYVLYETGVPNGYERAEKVVFKVNADGTISKTSGAAGSVDGAITENDNTWKLTLSDKPITMQIKKVDFAKPEGKDIDEANLGYATFTVTGNFALDTTGKIEGITSANVGTKLAKQLIAGEAYTFTETKAPDGYIQSATKTEVVFDTDGTIKSVDCTPDRESDNKALATGTGEALTVRNEPISIKVRKKDKAGIISLPGARFELADDTANPSVKKEVVTDAAGQLTLTGTDTSVPMIQGHQYSLTEMEPPYGYYRGVDDQGNLIGKVSITFTVDANGKMTEISKSGNVAIDQNGTAIDRDRTVINVKNEPIDLRLQKADADGNLIGTAADAFLAGAEFTVTGEFADGKGLISADKLVVKKDAEDVLKGRLVAGKTYQISETKTPDGYETAKDFEIVVSADGSAITVTPNDQNTLLPGKTTDAATNVHTVTVKDNPIEVSILKTDEVGKPLPEAEFTLTGSFAEGNCKEVDGWDAAGKFFAWTSMDTAKVFSAVLKAGETYTLTETKAPDGHVLPDPALKLEFKVGADGTLTFSENENFVGTTTDMLTVKNEQIALSLTKSDIADSGSQAIAGRGNAQFDIVPEQGSKFAGGSTDKITVSTAADGMDALAGKLIPSRSKGAEYWYTMTETTAPKGYQLAAPFTFKVDEQGRVTLKEKPKQAEAAPDGGGLVVKDRQIEVKLRKVSTETFNGAHTSVMDDSCVFEVTPATDKDAFAVAVPESKITLNKSNIETALNGVLVAENTYKVHEVTAPKGYELAEDFTFTVGEDGSVAVSEAAGEFAKVISGEADEVELVVADEPISVKFLKRLAGDVLEEGIEGAEFTISGKLADGREECEFTSETEAIEIKELLIGGETYALTETVAPAGSMTPMAGTEEKFAFTFTVDANGVVTDVEKAEFEHNTGISYDKETDTITFFNQPTAITIFKKGTDTEGGSSDPLLEQCTFDVTGVFAPDRYAKKERGTDVVRSVRAWFGNLRAGRAGGTVETIRVTTTGQDGLNNALKGRLIVGETYTIKEIAAPNGYQVGGSMTFEVNGTVLGKDGSMKLQLEMQGTNGNYDISYDEDGNAIITQRDLPVEFKLRKLNEEKEALQGAEFAVTGMFEKEQTESTRVFVSDANGYIDLSKLVNEYNEEAGQEYIYKIIEKTAPAGYQKLEGEIYLRLNSVDQGDGMHKTEAEILYGSGQTPERAKRFLGIDKQDGAEILNIQNTRIPEVPKAPNDGGVQTGDTQPILLYVLALLAAVAAAVAVIIWRRSRNRK